MAIKPLLESVMTKDQLKKFVQIRNHSSSFISNFQFQCDAEECGFSVEELGKVQKLPEGGGYLWKTPHGDLVEFIGGVLELRE